MSPRTTAAAPSTRSCSRAGSTAVSPTASAPPFSEELVYDADGKLRPGRLMDYGLPAAADLPPLETVILSFPSMGNGLIRGVGESGAITRPPPSPAPSRTCWPTSAPKCRACRSRRHESGRPSGQQARRDPCRVRSRPRPLSAVRQREADGPLRGPSGSRRRWSRSVRGVIPEDGLRRPPASNVGQAQGRRGASTSNGDVLPALAVNWSGREAEHPRGRAFSVPAACARPTGSPSCEPSGAKGR